MPQLYPYSLFISHAWQYSDAYNRMVSLLDNAPNFRYRNYSVPQADPFDVGNRSRLEEALRNQMRPTQVVLILAGMYVNHSDWIQFEMNYALTNKKPIIGVRPFGAERVPQAVVDAATEMVNWNSASVVDAIRRLVP